METKSIYNPLLMVVATLALGLGACTKLEPEMYSDLTTKNAYSSESDIDAALTGVYASLAPYPGDAYLYYAGYLVMLTDYSTDMGYSTAAGDPTKLSNFIYDDNNRYFRLNWQNMYQLIGNANQLLANIDAVPMSEENKREVIGQARFLRALSYKDLSDAWGPVPMVVEMKNPAESAGMPLSPVSRIDSLIVADCSYAAANLPEKWPAELGIGRATRGAALALMGMIYLRAHDYENAKIYIDQVLELESRGVYRLNPDFKNEWSDRNKMDMGLIFGILHEPSQNGGEITNHFGPSDHPVVQNRWQYYGVSLQFWRSYSDLDPRKDFFYYNYEGASPRDGSTDNGFFYMVPQEGQTTPPSDTVKFLQNVATKKYSYDMISNSYLDGRTIQVLRLADMILCKAEIENELNGPTAALPFLNRIRTRAGAPAYGSHPDFPVPGSKESMAEAILHERGFELVFEYKRRPDLIRFDKYEEISNAYLEKRGLRPVVRENMRFFPYPLDEARLNPEMSAANANRLPQ